MEKPLIMVVEDEVEYADKIANAVRNTGKYEVIVAYSAKEAFENIKKNKVLLGIAGNRIKLIVLDIKMPEMDGLQFLEKLRKDYGWYGEDVGVIVLTAYEDQEKWERATSGFIINYIRKPFEREDLIKTIDRFFAGEEPKMVLETFEKHIEKREEWKKEKESQKNP